MTRHPRVVLAIGVAVFAGHVVGRWYAPRYGALEDTLILPLMVVIVVSIILLIAASTAERPPGFIVRSQERSFSPPPGILAVASAAISTVPASFVAGELAQSVRRSHDVDLLTGILTTLCVSLVALGVVGAWRDRGLQLRPEGLYWRVPTGSMRVPWEALAPGHPPRPELRANTLTLTYARPELVRRRGLVLKKDLLRIDTVHAWFIADAIRHYVTHPEYRAAIGTEAEYRRLLYTLHNGPAGPTQVS